MTLVISLNGHITYIRCHQFVHPILLTIYICLSMTECDWKGGGVYKPKSITLSGVQRITLLLGQYTCVSALKYITSICIVAFTKLYITLHISYPDIFAGLLIINTIPHPPAQVICPSLLMLSVYVLQFQEWQSTWPAYIFIIKDTVFTKLRC